MKAIIGDVHGCYHTLIELYNTIVTKYPRIDIYCVGDLVDRGYYSAETVQFVIDQKIKCVLGNHDCMYYYYFSDPSHPVSQLWDINGNSATLQSYMKHTDMLDSHIAYIGQLPLFYDSPDCLISHAGISLKAGKELGLSREYDINKIESYFFDRLSETEGILWNRAKLFNIGKIQVVGHTHRLEVVYHEQTKGLYIDTGAYAMNKLSAVIIEDGEFTDAISVPTIPIDVSKP
ncbi:MAG: Bis(5'-nucleosyl)-tetraphosphatase, symmetrical [Ignavibacteriaceae bacterium]|nr:Bis(5'-nucleosyl)-tetraphosphatase, symmetrical [Ignavibacteriaceae bacterium]